MSTDARGAVLDWLRAEFLAEQRAGFTRLGRVPDTRVICFLDHYATLTPAEQHSLVEVILGWSANQWLLPPPNPAYEQYAKAMALPGMNRGVRYSGVNLLAGLVRDLGVDGVKAFYQGQGLTGLALEPSPAFLANLTDLRPLSAASLRRQVDKTLAKHFSPRVTSLGSEIWRYQGELSGSELTLDIRYSTKALSPQLAYQVRVVRGGRVLAPVSLCFESAFGVGMGHWNYLTSENVERSLDLLCELLTWLAELPTRLPN